jgi:hypothetical protein
MKIPLPSNQKVLLAQLQTDQLMQQEQQSSNQKVLLAQLQTDQLMQQEQQAIRVAIQFLMH